ncbi:hypothetical protein N234_28800 [Ralstonia pickettii DTP0602]|nr:hypothetical protein N234_28800 [Ralstonia pickettii DTP0602]
MQCRADGLGTVRASLQNLRFSDIETIEPKCMQRRCQLADGETRQWHVVPLLRQRMTDFGPLG